MSKLHSGKLTSKLHHVYDIGYERRSIEDFLSILQDKNIEVVIDIRERALSRKKEFNKERLKRNLKSKNIDYKHFKELGSPFTIRQAFRKNKNHSEFFKGYQKHLQGEQKTLAEVEQQIQNSFVCTFVL